MLNGHDGLRGVVSIVKSCVVEAILDWAEVVDQKEETKDDEGDGVEREDDSQNSDISLGKGGVAHFQAS